jgi:hypothetical protein
MAEHTPHYGEGRPVVTYTTTAAVTAGQVVENTGNMTVGPAAAASTKVVGVAAHDAASGALVSVYSSGVHDLTAQGAIAAGVLVKVGTVAGSVATIGAGTFDQAIGRALEAIADTAKGRVVILTG